MQIFEQSWAVQWAEVYGLWGEWQEINGDTGQVERAFTDRCSRLGDGPKDMETLIPEPRYFIGKCDLAGVIRLSWVKQVDPKCVHKCP